MTSLEIDALLAVLGYECLFLRSKATHGWAARVKNRPGMHILVQTTEGKRLFIEATWNSVTEDHTRWMHEVRLEWLTKLLAKLEARCPEES
jgi:hypothetical protein